jgi:hypothetical protein
MSVTLETRGSASRSVIRRDLYSNPAKGVD